MDRLNLALDFAMGTELERVVEPLASYISASDKPKTALLSALAVLIHEVRQTNRMAHAHLAGCSENC